MSTCTVETPYGRFLLSEEAGALVSMTKWAGEELPPAPCHRLLHQAVVWLADYFRGVQSPIPFPLQPQGSAFQRRVWGALQRIPYGTTVTYGEIAASIGQPSASRSVGAACGQNPIPILIPCHRVVGKQGKLTGYAFGVEMKRSLLALEHVSGFDGDRKDGYDIR